MRNKSTRKFESIDIGDLFETGKSRSIKNFYMTDYGAGRHFFRNGTSFIFNGFAISLCLSGLCSMKVGGRHYDVAAGSFIILSPNLLVEIVGVSDDFSLRNIVVSLDVILEFPSPVDINIMNSSLKNPVIALSDMQTKTLLYALMLEICNIYRGISGENDQVARPKPEKLTDDFFLLLNRYYKTEHNAGFYADKLNRTPKYLSTAIKKLSGRSVSDWINSTLVSEIKLLLKVTDKTILEISEELNFSSPSVFVQFFRRNTGITPLQYRKQF